MATVGGLCAACSDDEPSPVGLTILYTSDEHSRLLAHSPELDGYPLATSPGDGTLKGGVARRAAVLSAERARARELGNASLTLSAGDNTMGALPTVALESDGLDYRTMAALGYDATVLGNHEFDYGPRPLGRGIEAASAAGEIPPIVMTNIHFAADDPGDDALEAQYSTNASDGAPIHPYRVITTGNGLRVGLVGVLGARAAFLARNKVPVRFSAPSETTEDNVEEVLPLIYADLQPTVNTLRYIEQVDFVVALSHSGLGNDPSPDGVKSGEDYRICQHVAGLDLIISGHSHNTEPTPVVVANAGGGQCVVLNAGAEGRQVGRIDFRVVPGGSEPPTWDTSTQALLAVDDTVVPDPEWITRTDGLISLLEAAGSDAGGRSYLEDLLSRATGTGVEDDPGTAGDLYFRQITQTPFDLDDKLMLNYLSADAMLAATDDLGIHTDMALESAGVVREPIFMGRSGVISVTDAFNVVPGGNSPKDGSIGYPLLRVHVSMLELRAIFEFTAAFGPADDDYLLGQAGVRASYDRSRPPFESLVDLFDDTKGWVVKIEVDSDHSDGTEQYDTLLYDRATGFESEQLVSAVTSTYIAQFAMVVGVTLKDEAGEQITVQDAILARADQSEVKQLEAFFSFLHGLPGGTLPERYDVASGNRTDRQPCVAGCD